MESTIGQRIRKLREAKQLSVTDFAKAAGVKPSAIYGLESDANKPSIETVGTLRQSFPDLNTEWLQFGVGAMFKDDKELTPLSQLPPPVPSEAKPTQPGSGEQPVPHMAINADGEIYWRSIATERLKQIESLEKTVERLWRQNDTLLEGKPEASPEAASLRDTIDEIAHSLPSTVGQLGFKQGVHRQLAVAS